MKNRTRTNITDAGPCDLAGGPDFDRPAASSSGTAATVEAPVTS
jgi:hypothetical protein